MFDYNQEWTNERFQCEIFMFDQITLLNVSDSSSTEKKWLSGQQPPPGMYSYAQSITECTQDKHLLRTGLCFQCGLELFKKCCGQLSKRLGRTNTSSFLLRANVSEGDRVCLHCKHKGVKNQCHIRLMGDFQHWGTRRQPQMEEANSFTHMH